MTCPIQKINRMTDFTKKVIDIIEGIPRGKVLSYGQIADLAGNPYGARQVSRILHSCSRKYDLPWHRVINSKGNISFKEIFAYEEQKSLLLSEGIIFDEIERIDLKIFSWFADLSSTLPI